MIVSDRDGGPDHRRNPQLLHLTSSAIGRTPQDSTEFQFLLQHVDQSGRTDFGFLRNHLAGDFPEKATEFVLDSELDRHYRSAVLSAVFERTLGRLQVSRVGSGRRYRIEADIEGEEHDLREVFEVNLEASRVTWRRYEDEPTLSATFIEFGSVRSGEAVTRSVTVDNFTGGSVRLRVPAPPHGVFTWAAVDASLPHGARREIPVRFTSIGHDRSGTLVITTGTGSSARTRGVNLHGKGPGGFEPSDPDDPPPLPVNLIVRPTVLNFGGMRTGETATQSVTIENPTGRTISVTVPSSSSGAFRWQGFSGSLPNRGQRSVTVTFRSTGAIEQGTLTVSSDTPGSPQRVSMAGKGIGGFPTPVPDGPGP